MLGFSVEKHIQNFDITGIKGKLVNALTPAIYALITSESGAIDFFTIASQVTGKAFVDLVSIRSEVNRVLAKHQRKKLTYRLYLAPYRKNRCSALSTMNIR